MSIEKEEGWGTYTMRDLSANDLRSLLNMINSAQLPERREFNGLKNQITRVLAL